MRRKSKEIAVQLEDEVRFAWLGLGRTTDPEWRIRGATPRRKFWLGLETDRLPIPATGRLPQCQTWLRLGRGAGEAISTMA